MEFTAQELEAGKQAMQRAWEATAGRGVYACWNCLDGELVFERQPTHGDDTYAPRELCKECGK